MSEQLPAREAAPPPAPVRARRGLSPALLIFVVIPLTGLAIAFGVLLADAGLPGAPGAGGPATVPTQALPSLNYAAENFTLPTLAGDSVSLTDYSGRVVFLNFWATWCAPCVRELPTFQTFAAEQQALGEGGAVVLAVNHADSAEQIRAFLDEHAIRLDAVPVLLDSNSALYRRFAVPVLPTTFVISPDGIVSHVKYGELRLAELYGYLALFQ